MNAVEATMPRADQKKHAHPHEITELLERWNAGDPQALDELMPNILRDLRRLAQSFMSRERPAHTLQATALVNEVYLHLAGRRTVQWKDRRQFFTFLGNIMRRILIDHSRLCRAAKRGGGEPLVPLDETLRLPGEQDPDLEALDDALRDLSRIDPRQGRIVEMRYFAGLGVREIAEAEGISPTTVKRDWQTARLWLLQHLSPTESPKALIPAAVSHHATGVRLFSALGRTDPP